MAIVDPKEADYQARYAAVARIQYAEKLAKKFTSRLDRIRKDMQAAGFYSMAEAIITVTSAARYDIPFIKEPVK